jgi:uncharacterized protein YbaR (Trm112 family)
MTTHASDIEEVLDILRCPVSHSKLTLDGDELVAVTGEHRYRIEDGIPNFVVGSYQTSSGEGDGER